MLIQARSRIHALEHELLSCRELEDTYHSVSLWVLNTSLNAGDTIQEEDCIKVIAKTQDVTELSLPSSGESFVGLSAKTALKKGSVLSEEMFYDAGAHPLDRRLIELTDLTLPSWISAGDLIDLRIRFPNGEDYIVISQQTVSKLLVDETSAYGLWLELTEEDLLRLSSARYDRDAYKDCTIYVTKYELDFEEASEKDYPVNPDVFTLMKWDPNIVNFFTVKDEAEKRTQLESHLEVFLQEETIVREGSSYDSATDSETGSDSAPDSTADPDGSLTDSASDENDAEDGSLTVYHP